MPHQPVQSGHVRDPVALHHVAQHGDVHVAQQQFVAIRQRKRLRLGEAADFGRLRDPGREAPNFSFLEGEMSNALTIRDVSSSGHSTFIIMMRINIKNGISKLTDGYSHQNL